ncbi:MAG: hypothetical protein JSW50_02065 [Candidatus Latescibacterota bacterium]|nr:MAG: hypothetical protein JSW50_02065 [Candidatus Latescibacterota bacterium]
MKAITWLLLCCLAFVFVGSCTKKESSDDTATQKESTEVTEASDEVAIVGKWRITEWKADHVDQFEMWRIGDLTVEFRGDGSIESQLVYSNGDERKSGGTWKRSADNVEIIIKGGGETEGDEPFERTREFIIDELSLDSFSVRGEIGPTDNPIVLTYKAQRLPDAE